MVKLFGRLPFSGICLFGEARFIVDVTIKECKIARTVRTAKIGAFFEAA